MEIRTIMANQLARGGQRNMLSNTRGNLASYMLNDIKTSASKVTKAASENLLSLGTAIANTPQMFKQDIVLIDARESDNNQEILFKQLFSIIRNGGQQGTSALSLGASVLNIVNPDFGGEFTNVLKANSVTVTTMGVITFRETYTETQSDSFHDLSPYDLAEAPHYVYGFSLLMNLIGKRLDSKNFSNWIKRRMRSYAAPLGLSAGSSTSVCFEFHPSQTFCSAFYDNVRIYWEVRRLFFENIYGISKREDLLAQGCRITVSLLRGAEMSNWNFISYWILLLNPDLVMWNELAKYLPHLCAAYAKYLSIGNLAEWSKLILPPEEVEEFNSRNLAVPYAVAKAIAATYGNPSINQLEGVRKDAALKTIVDQALYIVKVAGGARTIDVMALRAWRFGTNLNPELTARLDVGALNTLANQEEEPPADLVADRVN